MSVDQVYQPSPIKRSRSTKAEVETRREALWDIIQAGKPMTVRQVFYQATVRGLVEKAESGYQKVQTDLTLMRRAGDLPYDWLADNTRWQRKPRTFNGIEAALKHTVEFYRKALWADADCYVEIWIEKDALAGVVLPITAAFDVPLMVARGYASLSFLYTAAEYINNLAVPTYIYHLGDFDPSGVNAAEKIEETLGELAPDAEIYFERIAVTPEQIEAWRKPSRSQQQWKEFLRAHGTGSVAYRILRELKGYRAPPVFLHPQHWAAPDEILQMGKHETRAHQPGVG